MTDTLQPTTYKLRRGVVLGIIALVTFICYQRSLHNQFTNWDDDVYVSHDTTIQKLNWQNLKTIFTEDITKNNYHPFCMLSLAINYQFAKLNPYTYYLTNILIHIANTVLIFFLITGFCKLISIAEEESFLMATLGSLIFGVHPLHVESVSWIAERKDVLYTFFYLWGLLTYLKYLATNTLKWYWITFALFIASCLSKPMAVVFPLSMLVIDLLAGKKPAFKMLFSKTPFFLAALVAGAFAIYTQNKTGAIASFDKLTIAERLMYASYGFIMYIWKFFNPSFLSTFYPYPYRYIDGSLPNIYYAAPFIALAIIGVPAYYALKKHSKYAYMVLFGLGFYLVNVIFVLQIISCGAAIMADRYSYVSSIGLIFITVYFINELITRLPKAKSAILAVVLALSAALSYGCYQRTQAWHNSETLYTDAIKKYPYQALLSYKWLGYYYMDIQDTDNALANFEVLTKLHFDDAKIYDIVGNIYSVRGRYKDALEVYDHSLKVENNVYITYADKAMAYAAVGDTINAVKSYVQAYQLNQLAETRVSERSFTMVQQKQYKPVIIQYNILLMLNPNNPFYYFYRGCAKYGLNDMDGAIKDFTMSMRFNNRDVLKVATYNLAVACDSVHDDKHALQYANMAAALGAPSKPEFMEKLKRRVKEQR